MRSHTTTPAALAKLESKNGEKPKKTSIESTGSTAPAGDKKKGGRNG